ncbi:ribosome maturation factor RimP [Periweissella cryptocerci]|uniref:Ribosome maturation factor RimP n=1 Tax=Periweissella cryptocerci TaxID=2506420 RepID=A0A4P6YWG4_9LACO|nr:ribosome maturation factor RimP [Periweissella cryptocerci]QBO37136.1 ribosome maturation factor RimP [Periweissella cryptocerci]
MANNVVETITKLVTPIVEAQGLDLWDVEFVKEGRDWFLRILLDKKPDGITMDDIVVATNQISELLDEVDPDPIPQAYMLEISSPGAERPLKKPEDYVWAKGQYVHVSLYQKLDGVKEFEGDLVEVTDEELTLTYMDKTRQKTVVIPRDSVAKARLAIKF